MNVLAYTLVSLLLFLLYWPNGSVVVGSSSSADSCATGRDGEDGCGGQEESVDHKYSKASNTRAPEKSRWAGYLEQIKLAEASYVECRNVPESCSCYQHLIEGDLEPFEEINLKMLSQIRDLHLHAVTYQIIAGKLYRSQKCLFPFRCKGIEHFLIKLAKKLPDVEFVVNVHDWPYVNRHFQRESGPLPLFSFSKTSDYYDISYPAWTFWEGGPAISLYPTGLGRWDQFRESLTDSALKYPWEKKKDVAFFRGSRTSGERDNLIFLSRNQPDLVDAEYTKNQAWRSKKDTLDRDPAPEVALEKHCKFKYLFNYRGVAASFRFKHLFLCGSTVLHVGDEWTEFFYPIMKPWIHFVPVDGKATKSDLKNLILFLRENQGTAETIAQQGQQFIRENLRMADVECYWQRLLTRYQEKMNFKPQRNPDFHEIKQ